MLRQVPWDATAEAAFLESYGEPGQVAAHRSAVEAGTELLMECGGYGFATLRLESDGGVVVTGAAGEAGGFDYTFDALEAFFPCVSVETYRDGLLKKLRRRGYQLDHVRLFKRVIKI
jgi:hypothetical protein